MAVCLFVPFLSDIVLSVLLRFTDSDYPFGICKLFLFDRNFIDRKKLNLCTLN
jgi:hypothetical protein